MEVTDLRAAVRSVRTQAEEFLCELIRLPSLPGEEAGAIDCAARWFSPLAEVERIPLSDSLRHDEDYSDPVAGLRYDGRSNLRLRRAGLGSEGRSLLINTHLDVVPASEGQQRPFDPAPIDGVVSGRGACDAKG